MGWLEDEIARRRGYAGAFVLHFLTTLQLEGLEAATEGKRGAELASARQDYQILNSNLRLTVNRLVDEEVQEARQFGKRTGVSPERHLWPLFTNHIVKAEERNERGWEEVPTDALDELFDRSDRAEREFLIQSYIEAVEAERRDSARTNPKARGLETV